MSTSPRSGARQRPEEEAWLRLSRLSEANLSQIQRIGRRLLDVRSVRIVRSRAGEAPASGEAVEDDPFFEALADAGSLLVIEDARADARFRELTQAGDPPAVRFFAGLPLEGAAGERLGWLLAADDEPRTPDAAWLAALGEVAGLAAVDLRVGGVAEELRNAEETHYEQRRQHETLLANLPGMAYRCRNEPAWPMEFISEGSLALTGYPPEALLAGDPVHFAELIFPEDRPRVWEAVQEALSHRQPFRVNYRLRDSEGRERWVWEQGRGVFDDDGAAAALEGFIADVTETRRYEEELVETRRIAEEMSRLKGTLLSNMSHEIRTPLTGILGFAELLTEEIHGPEKDFARHIKSSGERLLDTLNAVLDLSTLEAGTLELQPKLLDVGQEVGRLVESMRPLAEKKGLSLDLSVVPERLEARLDPAALGRVVSHLVGNAVKFTNHGSVRVLVQRLEDLLVLTVEDTGVGIDPLFRPRIFEAFAQESTGDARSHEGVGLGLTIVQHLVTSMGGDIEVASRKGEGSSFIVTIPQESLSEEAGRGIDAPSSDGRRRGCRLLAVEDNKATRILLDQVLGRMPEVESVETAGDGNEALYFARQHPHDALLIDINLGTTQTGLDVLHELRALPTHAGVPAVAVTAYASPADRARLIEAGFDAFVAKPFTPEHLLATLREVLFQDEDRPSRFKGLDRG